MSDAAFSDLFAEGGELLTTIRVLTDRMGRMSDGQPLPAVLGACVQLIAHSAANVPPEYAPLVGDFLRRAAEHIERDARLRVPA